MIEVEFFIPLADNSGRLFDQIHDQAFLDFLLAEFGACTVLPGTAVGNWVDAGVTYTDQIRIVLVAVSGMVAAGGKLLAAVELAKAHYQQLAIYVRYLGQSEVL